MPTDAVRTLTPPLSYPLRLIAWSLALFGLVRLPWIGVHVLLPLTRWQAAAGSTLFGPSALPMDATLACSGADALALCFSAILAYPTRWRSRAAGVAVGVAVILVLNTIRIGTLGRALASPRWFDALHLYIWPAVLTMAIAAFVYGWMRVSDKPERDPATTHAPLVVDWRATRRFVLVAAALLLTFVIASPLYLESARVLVLAGAVARAAAALLRLLGVDATATAGLLSTPRGSFLVTQACIATPLIPVYFAAVLVYSRAWWARILWTAAALPVFFGLGVARLLVVVVPAGLDVSFSIHAFSQVLIGVSMVCGLAIWRYGTHVTTWVRVIAAMAVALAFVSWVGAPYTRAVLAFGGTSAVIDAQGAWTFLAAFQFGMFLALWIAAFMPRGWTRFLSGAALLTAMQVAVANIVQLVAVHAGVTPAVRDIRAWALLAPALVIAAVVNIASPRR